jgi:ubiquinone/menaquinone biosynthesis C-methylase UbiE
MKLEPYEQWWEKNLGGKEYEHEGIKHKSPSIEHFGGKWMGDEDCSTRKFHRQFFGHFKSILDAGCGACPEYYSIAKNYKGVKYTGLDITPKLVEYNKSKGIDCHQGSLNSIPFQDDSFDIVLSRHVVEHMSNIEKPLLEMIRVAKKRVIISFFIDVLEAGDSHIITLDEKGTEFEVYHNRYSKTLIEKILSNHPKVFNFSWETPDYGNLLVISV